MKSIINQQRLIATFVDLVKIPSPSWEEKRVIDYIVNRVSSYNVECKIYPCEKSHNVLIRIPGDTNYVPIMFSCHMDTVTPCDDVKPIITKNKICSDGTTILGADDKSAIAAFLEVIDLIAENHIPHGHIEFLFSCAEEVGLCGAKCFDTSQLKAKYAFVFDSDGPVGTIIVAAPYHMSMNIRVKGKAAHAGMEPEKGISAIRVISEIISSIPHGRIDSETTANVGVLSGGRATNIVAEDAECTLEIRSLKKSKLLHLKKEIEIVAQTVSKRHGANVTIKNTMDYNGYAIKETHPIVIMASQAIQKIGITPKIAVSGGGSDTNIFNSRSLKAVNLSSGMRNVHTTKEYIAISDLMKNAMLVLSLIDNARKQ